MDLFCLVIMELEGGVKDVNCKHALITTCYWIVLGDQVGGARVANSGGQLQEECSCIV